jgi:co-chaperonin GroES (HSP10)
MKNVSGINPTEFKVLISPLEITTEHKFTGADGREFTLHKPEEFTEREQFSQQIGTLVALAPLAFTYDKWEGCEDQKPKPGDKVLFAKFAGFAHKGKDGKTYRVVNDKDVSAVLA